MKITGLKVHLLEWERSPYRWRDGLMPGSAKRRQTLLRMRIEEIWQDLWQQG